MEGGVRANILCLPSILYSQADICCPLTKVFLGNLVVILGNRNQPPFIAHREEFRNYFCQCNGNGNGGLRPFRPPLHRCQFVGWSVGRYVGRFVGVSGHLWSKEVCTTFLAQQYFGLCLYHKSKLQKTYKRHSTNISNILRLHQCLCWSFDDTQIQNIEYWSGIWWNSLVLVRFWFSQLFFYNF